MTNHENLVIHPDRFEDMAVEITNNLLARLIGDTQADYDCSIAMIMRTFQHQLFLHRNWGDEYEGRATKFRADRTDAEEAAARAIDG